MDPTMVIPIAEILSVLRVNFALTEQNNTKYSKKDFVSSHYKYKRIYQFEIFTEYEDYPYKEEIECEIFNQNEIEKENRRRRAKRERDQSYVDLFQADRSRVLVYKPEKFWSQTTHTASKKVLSKL